MSTNLQPASTLSAADLDYMRQALALAEAAIGLTEPNPRVGCVIINPQGQIIGRGHTQQAGGPHAEVMALREAGELAAGASAYVTLEPCAHFGRTPPCCDALVAAKLARVVVAMRDNNPQVAGQGIARLLQAGIVVQELPADSALARQAYELNIGFFSRMQRARPWVRLKAAASLDGKTALQNGVSQWITGPDARADGHLWRKRAAAILTGVGTVLADNPRLDVRLVETAKQPLRVILDSQLRTPPSAAILQAPGSALIYYLQAAPERVAALQQAGAEVVQLAATSNTANTVNSRIDLHALLADLAKRGINELHVEAGQELNASFLRADLVDELLFYLAPLLLGPGREVAGFAPLLKLEDGIRMQFHEVQMVGTDMRILARRLAPSSV